MTGNRGTMYIRFAHEMNGNWYAWSVPADQIDNFKAGWRRYRTIQKEVFPEAKLVFGTNGDTVAANGTMYNLHDMWPGDGQVDVYSTDWYGNHYEISGIGGAKLDSAGGPMDLYEHQKFAQQYGVPMGISEWGVNHNPGTGDDPNYIQYVYDFCHTHGRTGAGNLLYECYFNYDNGGIPSDFPLMNPDCTTRSSNAQAAARYIELFGG